MLHQQQPYGQQGMLGSTGRGCSAAGAGVDSEQGWLSQQLEQQPVWLECDLESVAVTGDERIHGQRTAAALKGVLATKNAAMLISDTSR
jgi:hypothetical protein